MALVRGSAPRGLATLAAFPKTSCFGTTDQGAPQVYDACGTAQDIPVIGARQSGKQSPPIHAEQTMIIRNLIGIASAAAAAAGGAAYLRYRKEIAEIRDEVDRGSMIAETSAGDIEYGESGEGEPVLVIHGAGGGYDQGLLIGADLGPGYRIIAPSRFGYLKTPVPEDCSLRAQADAYAALLEFFDIKQAIVVAVSAGAPSGIELALRHPDKVSALILCVPRAYDPTNSMGVDRGLRSQAVLGLVEASADFLFWAAAKLARPSVVSFLGVPPEVEAAASEQERQLVTEVIRSILPLSSRMKGLMVDNSTEITPWPLDKITAPTLIISAEDDLYRTLPGARFTAEHIVGAQLCVLKEGGHLMVGQGDKVHRWIADFLQSCRRSRGRTTRGANGIEKQAA
jgi:2-hydroxy-6-oxonona-2,4-dienedioate hydrolase